VSGDHVGVRDVTVRVCAGGITRLAPGIAWLRREA